MFVLLLLQWIYLASSRAEAAATASRKKDNALANATQQLTFGAGGSGASREYWCDVILASDGKQLTTKNVTIFKKTSRNKDSAVAVTTIFPTRNGRIPSNAVRLEIPPTEVKRDPSNEYTFEFVLRSDGTLFSEPWAYDPENDQFALCSAITKTWYKSPVVFYSLIGLVILVLFVMAYMLVRSFQRKKASAI